MAEKKAENAAKNEPKMVNVRLYMGDRAETKAPLNVYINGVKYTIERGKNVEVPDFVAACIQDSEDARIEESAFNDAARMVKYN